MPDDNMDKLHELITTVRMDIRELNVKFDQLQKVDAKVEAMSLQTNTHEQQISTLSKKVETIENHNTWLWRMVATATFGSICSVGVTVFLIASDFKGG